MSNVTKLIIIFTFIAILGSLIIWQLSKNDESVDTQTILTQNPSSSYTSKIDSQGEVTIEIVPQKLGLDREENVFEITLDTHSIDLSFDFLKIVVLRDELGNNYQALRWSGGKGGHHLRGEITFPKLQKGVRKVTLEIDGMGMAARSFSWGL